MYENIVLLGISIKSMIYGAGLSLSRLMLLTASTAFAFKYSASPTESELLKFNCIGSALNSVA